ncbi:MULTISPECIES: hypothetical protein [unclassified Serratia (in: enterobacteria)]|uniref:hypothetical protein n=1 Tax=unclassified Serratia (in: enterobacteria) TaxID=2647522 RepID=UPI00046A95F7|nr:MULTISPECIES: hypothetical protein [unclassified Serratia (in: enterobacteria)]
MKLLAPLGYLKIRHDEKWKYDFGYPVLGALMLTICYGVMSVPFSILGKGGLVPQVNGLLQVLIGFYIAALAAVATFSNPAIDELMAGTPPTIKEQYRENWLVVPLKRRRFLCYLFGYLALLSFSVFGFGLAVSLFTDSVINFIILHSSPVVLKCFKVMFLFIYSTVLLNLVTTTLLGLYYLSIRIHQPNL